jgi:aquaporin NIP
MAPSTDLIRKMTAEAVGTFLLVFAGTGAILAGGSYVLGFGFAMIAVAYAFGNISGAHVNPAVTLGLASVGRFPMLLVPYYWFSQVLGALVASLLLRMIHGNIENLGANQVAPGYSLLDGFLMELIGTAVFLVVIVSVATDKRVHPAVPGLAIGSTLLVIQLFGGGVSGGSVNPARSLAPSLISGSFTDLWIYLTAPFIGAVIGAIGFEFMRGSEEGSTSIMATNIRRMMGSVQNTSGGRSRPPRQQPTAEDAYGVDDYAGEGEVQTPPRRQQRPPSQQQRSSQQRAPQADAYEYDEFAAPPQQPARQRPPASYDPDAPVQQQRPPSQQQRPSQQRRRPPQQ